MSLLFSAVVMAGGSKVGLTQTNVEDKNLTAGTSDQLLMSFTLEPWGDVTGDVTIESLSMICSSPDGFLDLKLIHNDEVIMKIGIFEIEDKINICPI